MEESRLRKYHSLFKRCITDETVVATLNADVIISNDESDRLKSLYRKGESQQATAEMLDLFLKSHDERKMGSLKTALRENGHTYLKEILEGKHDPQNDPREITMLRLFYNSLAKRIRVAETLSHVFAKGLIEEIDREEICTKLEQEGNIKSAMLLLDKIQRKKPPREWYYGFLQSLVESKQENLAFLIEPDFESDPSSFSPLREDAQASSDEKVWDDSVKEFVLTDSCEAANPWNNLSDQPPTLSSFDEDDDISEEEKAINVDTAVQRNNDIHNNLDSMNIKVPMGKMSLEEATDAKGQVTNILNEDNFESDQPESEPTESLHGYIHHVSQKRTGREKKNPFFLMTIQTGQKSFEDVIVYGHELWQEFVDLEEEGSIVSLIGLLKRPSINKEGSYEYQFVCDSRICSPQFELNFHKTPPPISSPCLIEHIIKKAKIKTLVNVQGKVISKDPVRERIDSLGDLIKYCDIIIKDSTNTISMTLYAEKCSMVEVGKWYIFRNVRVKYWAKKKLASIVDTKIIERFNEEEDKNPVVYCRRNDSSF